MTFTQSKVSTLHILLALIFLPPLLLTTLTGILLGFYDQLRYVGPPYGLEHPTKAGLTPIELIQVIQGQFPNHHLDVLFLATTPTRAIRAKLSGSSHLTIFLHPASGKVITAKTPDEQDWLEILYDLHPGKVFGFAGKVLFTSLSAVVLLLWVTGVTVRAMRHSPWWSGPRIPQQFNAPNWHRWIGYWKGLLLVLLFSIGSILNFSGPLIGWLDPPPQMRMNSTQHDKQIDLPASFTRIDRAYPQGQLERLIFPQATQRLLQARFDDGTWVYDNPWEEHIVEIKSSTSHWTRLLYPLHSGRILGAWGPLLIAGLGLILFLTILTGLVYVRKFNLRRLFGL